jgi:ATP-dependent Lhr-like helicase
LTSVARDVLAHLTERGASFQKDIGRATGHDRKGIDDALRELVFAGLVTSDGIAGLRALLDRVPGPGGRWSLLRKDVLPQADADAFARQLLMRYGIVFRDVLAREPRLPPWRDLLMVYRRMEARGEIRGGRFVAGFVGEQFALPEAVEAMRSVRRIREPEVLLLPATDPLNLVGVTTPGPRVPAVSGNAILYKDGVPIASREAGKLVVRSRLSQDASGLSLEEVAALV